MEGIHGVSFRDYACASANIAGGMGLDQVCKVLGLEEPLWAEVQEFWNNKMAELSMEDMAFYGQVFTNPKQGKFANVEGAVGGPDDVLSKYPEWSDFLKMQAYGTEASKVGIEINFEKEFGITTTQYSQLGAHWSAYYKEKVMDVENFDSYAFEVEGGPAITPEQEERNRLFHLHTELMNKWEAYYQEKFKKDAIDLSDDIDF
jgi:triacylglycerol lipase